MDDPLDDDEENGLVKLTSLGVLGVGLAALFLGYEWFWIAFVVGFAVVVPAVKILTDEFGLGTESNRDADERPPATDSSGTPARANAPESKQEALDTLRDRYARGELSEAEFEQKVERLLETETLEGARDHVGRESAETSRESTDAVRESADPTREPPDPAREPTDPTRETEGRTE